MKNIVYALLCVVLFAGCTNKEDSYSVNASSLNMREEASANARIICKIQQNANVEVIEMNDDWTKIYYNGQNGYVSTKYLSKNENIGFGGILFFLVLSALGGGFGAHKVVHLTKSGKIDRRYKN